MTEVGGLDVVLCDTTFVSIARKALTEPRRIAHWPTEARERLDNAVLAISVVTLAEARFGYLEADWSTQRIDEYEAYLEHSCRCRWTRKYWSAGRS
jgi:predicted nucleic acid-binding protein